MVIVLGSAISASGGPTPTLRRRVVMGVRTFEKTGAGALLMSGGPAGRSPAESEVMRDLARLAGAPAASIFVETESSSTFENARRSADLMRRHGWRRAIVVTDAIHVRIQLAVQRRPLHDPRRIIAGSAAVSSARCVVAVARGIRKRLPCTLVQPPVGPQAGGIIWNRGVHDGLV